MCLQCQTEIVNGVEALTGHGFCKECLDENVKTERSVYKEAGCGSCRAPIGDHEPHPIFATFVEYSVEERADYAINGLDKFNETSPASSVEKAGRKIGEVEKILQLDATTSVRTWLMTHSNPRTDVPWKNSEETSTGCTNTCPACDALICGAGAYQGR